MDLLDRINSLTDDQLQMVAERDDASGVLASYRLAELRGLPYPDRSVVILGDEYAIIAQDGKIERVAIEADMIKIIREEDGEFCVYSADGSRSFGCYPSMEQAQERLQQIHTFDTEKEIIREGSFVSWNSSGGRARGRVEHVMTEGVLGVPDSDFSINAEPDDPAVLIRIWRQGPDGWRETETLVGHKMSTLTRIDSLSKQTKREDGQDFPPEAFAYVPDPEKPSTWKLRLWDSIGEKETRQQVGGAIAALGPGGFRGNRVEIPAEDLPEVKRRVREAWRRVWEGEDREMPEVLKQESYEPPQGVQDAAQRALRWIADGHAGSGFTDVGRARAAQLARGDNVSRETIGRMASFFARHEVNSQAEGWNSGEDGFPSPGRVAWDAWGGDAGKTWAESIVARDEKQACPPATQSIEINLAHRQDAIDVAMYGPLNPAEPNEEYWQKLAGVFDTTIEEAQSSRCGNCAAFDITTSMKDCIAEGVGDEADPYDVIDAGEIGYCRAFKFKCAAARTCSAWISGGPITDDTVQETKALSKAFFLKRAEEKRFTLGPLYVPDFIDAHGEWTDSEELQAGVWHWVRSGDRRIFLQHDTNVEAGEWVEVMTMPQPWTVDMIDSKGEPIGQVTYPPNTVFLGVVWNEDAWELVKRGELRGYSIGGYSDRVLADMPEKADREGLEIPVQEEPQDLAKAIASAVAAAMRDTSPTVNVVLPETRQVSRRIERDEHGNIVRIVEEEM